MFGPTFGFKNSQEFLFKEENYQKYCNPCDFYLLTWEKNALPYTSQKLG
jgi:hypothetical protein